MKRYARNILSVALVVAFLASFMPAVLADEPLSKTENLKLASDEANNPIGYFVRASGSSSETHGDTVQSSSAQLVVDGPGGAHRIVYLTFDLKDYINEFTTIQSINLRMVVAQPNNATNTPMGIFVMPQELETLPASGMVTYNNLKKLGMTDCYSELAGTMTIPKRTDVATLPVESIDIWPTVQRHLEQSPDDTRITIKLSEPSAGATRCTYVFSGVGTGDNAPSLNVKFTNEHMTRVENAKNAVTFDRLTSENEQNITGDLNLPLEEDGVSITWQSSNPRVLSNSGVVTRPAFGEDDVDLTLTASFYYGGYSTERVFNVKVLSDRVQPDHEKKALVALEGNYVNSAEPGSAMEQKQLMLEDGKMVSFLKFDLSSYRNMLDKIDSMLLRMMPYQGMQEGKGIGIQVDLLPDAGNWTGSSLTYDSANAANMLTGGTALYQYEGDLDFYGFYSDNIFSGIRQYLSENPATNTVTLRITATANASAFHGLAAPADELKPAIVVMTSADALAFTKEYLTFDKLSPEDITRVRRDLKLDKNGLYSTTITWESSDPAVIHPETGVVTRKAEDTVITLTAVLKNAALTDTVVYTVTVLGLNSDPAYFQMLLDSISFDTVSLTGDFTVPVQLEQMNVEWTAYDNYATKIDGANVKVSRLKNKDLATKLTATISDSGTTESKEFDFTVIRHPANDIMTKRAVKNPSGNEDNALDDDTTSAWTIGGKRSITVDLGTAKVFNEFLIVYKGTAATGLTIKTSQDSYVWKDIYTNGSIKPNVTNDLILDVAGYSRYVQLEFPNGVEAVNFIGCYANQAGGDETLSLWEKVELPSEVTGDFSLPQTVDSYEISWKSSDTSYIEVSGHTARVTRPTGQDVRVMMTATVEIDQTPCTCGKPVVVKKTSSSGGGSSGGGTGGKTNTMTVATPSPHPQPEPEDEPFIDLDSASWAKGYITSLCERGIISGKGNGTFDPNGYLKREEMAKLLAKGFALDNEQTELPFTDVQSDAWYYDFICALYGNGISNGMGDGAFGVGQNITRQDAALQIARIIKAKGITADEEAGLFADDAAIADYSKEDVYMMRALGIIGGDENGNFNPEQYITRAEISKILYNTLALF